MHKLPIAILEQIVASQFACRLNIVSQLLPISISLKNLKTPDINRYWDSKMALQIFMSMSASTEGGINTDYCIHLITYEATLSKICGLATLVLDTRNTRSSLRR